MQNRSLQQTLAANGGRPRTALSTKLGAGAQASGVTALASRRKRPAGIAPRRKSRRLSGCGDALIAEGRAPPGASKRAWHVRLLRSRAVKFSARLVRDPQRIRSSKFTFKHFALNEVWVEMVMLAHDLNIWTEALLLTRELANGEPNGCATGGCTSAPASRFTTAEQRSGSQVREAQELPAATA